ncbi:MAG TPA: hypothetical protein DCQ31_13685, partial [Bacteroidales bacterium]|nr:hypothetical protein [Bacteroidales bacterium]
WNFTTVAAINTPEVVTITDSVFTSNTAHVGGKIISDGGISVTEYGFYWGSQNNPEISGTKVTLGSEGNSFLKVINGLAFETYYFAKAYATNKAGTGFGPMVRFKTGTPASSEVKDYEGNSYKAVLIGTQNWMAENLKATKYFDGSSLTFANNKEQWVALSVNDKAYCWYNDNAANKNTYGALYTWAGATNGIQLTAENEEIQGVCPIGWHLPSKKEWEVLVNYLGGESVAGKKLKEAGYSHWLVGLAGDNESGFTALPGGVRSYANGMFSDIGYLGCWWTATGSEGYTDKALQMVMLSSGYFIHASETPKKNGVSVRCLRN